jgi:FAD/FMN-containing dehydrogenase
MAAHSTGGVYTNYLDQDDDEKVKSVYGEKYERLRKIKTQYDPDNFFRLNPNIKPQV